MGEVGEIPITSPDNIPSRWGYESHFREYLLLMARKGETALESIEKFPERIELSRDWHETFGKMSKQTEDGHERLALVGFKEDMRTLIMPTVYGFGENSNITNGYRANVPASVIREDIRKAQRKAHIIGLVGDIHTHPQEIFGVGGHIGKFVAKLENMIGDVGFSAGDLFGLIHKDAGQILFRAVVTGKDIYFAFRTKQTRKIDYPMSMEDFEKYWEKQLVDFKNMESYLNNLDINLGIARRHNLVLYKGKIGKDLKRIYP